MGNFGDMIVIQSDNENSFDSLELIDPVNNLSLEHTEKNKSYQDLTDQSNKLEKLHLNEFVQKRNKKTNRSRHHPYSKQKKPKPKTQTNKRDQCDTKFLRLGYIEYSSSKKCRNIRISNEKVDPMEDLFLQINQSIKSTFSKYLKSNEQSKTNVYICNRRSK